MITKSMERILKKADNMIAKLERQNKVRAASEAAVKKALRDRGNTELNPKPGFTRIPAWEAFSRIRFAEEGRSI